MHRVVAIMAVYNEERFISASLRHLFNQGIEAYIIDNCSSDRTVAIASEYLNRGVIGIETFPRNNLFSLYPLLRRKEELAASIEADWLIHLDADEFLVAPFPGVTLSQFFKKAEEEGYNAVNFLEFTFVPTQESPDHDHQDFQKTMRWYYPFLPSFPHRLIAWKRQESLVELAWSAGHLVRFPGLKMYPESCYMRHYQFLSVSHAITKYVDRVYDPDGLKRGWHGWHADMKPELMVLPNPSDLRTYFSDRALNADNPRKQHHLEEIWRREGMRTRASEIAPTLTRRLINVLKKALMEGRRLCG